MNDQAQVSCSNEAPNTNHVYALYSRGTQETSPNVVISMLKVLSLNVYDLLDSDATLSFVSPLIAKKV